MVCRTQCQLSAVIQSRNTQDGTSTFLQAVWGCYQAKQQWRAANSIEFVNAKCHAHTTLDYHMGSPPKHKATTAKCHTCNKYWNGPQETKVSMR
eukprot:5380051-Amphidinium_carterae.1